VGDQPGIDQVFVRAQAGAEAGGGRHAEFAGPARSIHQQDRFDAGTFGSDLFEVARIVGKHRVSVRSEACPQ